MRMRLKISAVLFCCGAGAAADAAALLLRPRCLGHRRRVWLAAHRVPGQHRQPQHASGLTLMKGTLPSHRAACPEAEHAWRQGLMDGALGCPEQAIKDSLDALPGGERTQIGFLTFDATLHFYNLKASLTQPQMMVRAP